MSKYKYYFKKPETEILKDVFKVLIVAGAVSIAATSPYFIVNLIKGFKWSKKYEKRKVYDAFYNLERQGCLDMEEKNHQIYISLTKKGKKRAGWLQIDDLKIRRPKKWDGKWRIVIFDIADMKKIYREAFRGKLKELGFKPLQKSVWIQPFDCSDEIELLKTFFGLTEKEVRLIIAEKVDGDINLKNLFDLN